MDILGLDIGGRRIGVARASSIARLPEPLKALPNDDTFLPSLLEIMRQHQVKLLVVGIPRNLNGQLTEQSRLITDFVERLSGLVEIPIVSVDESLSSKRADDFLLSSKKQFDQDSIAACYILEEYFTITPGAGE